MLQFHTALMLLLQAVLLTATQFFLKLALDRMGAFEWSKKFFREVLVNWPLAMSGICGLGAMILWIVILKKNDLSQVYPLTSVSYILALLAGVLLLNETVPLTRWIGVVIIMIGFYFVAKA